MLDYMSRGYYALQLEGALASFPREQTLVLDCADLFDDTNAACQRVFDFSALEARRDVEEDLQSRLLSRNDRSGDRRRAAGTLPPA